VSLDQLYFACWPQEKTGGQSQARYSLVRMEEGVKGSERSRDDTAVAVLTTGVSGAGYVEFTLPLAVGTVIPASTVFIVSVRAKRNAATDAGLDIVLVINGSTTVTGDKIGPFQASASTGTGTVTVSSEETVESSVVVRLRKSTSTYTGDCDLYYLHDDTHFGVDSTSTGKVARTPCIITALSPDTGSHASPTPIDSADFALEIRYAYADDVIELGKWTDTAKTAAHSASAETVQSVGGVDTETDSFPALSTRRMAFSADATRKPDALTNTYYVAEVLCGATSQGALAFETRLAAEQPTLTSLAGTSTTPVATTAAHPVVSWTHTNTTATHHRVRVYDVADDSLDHDSGELAGAAMQGSYVIDGADLAVGKSYYVKVTSMNGSGGSTWSIDSAAGYFDVEWTSTAAKITSHEGSSDTPEVIATRAPTITWDFSRTQAAYNLAVVDAADESIEYESGWVTSATKSQALPANELDLGHTYSIQVQVKDTQGTVYPCDKRAWVHVNEASVAAPTLTAEADATTADSVTLEWTAPAVNDGDALTYEVEITFTRTGGSATETLSYNTGTGTSLALGRRLAGSYSWRVRATDEHSMAGSWTAADVFAVTSGGAKPVVTLTPLATSTTTTPVSTWSVYDADDEAQTTYQVQIDNNADFGSITQDSGEVTSTAFHHAHTALAAGTWYRRVRVQTTGSATWSDWVDDSFVIAAPTAQTAEWEIYLDAEGTPTALDLTTYPVSGLTVTRRLDGPTEFSFSVNNFDGAESGIDDDEELLLYLKDSAGARLEFRGFVQEKAIGLMCEVRCADIAAKFSHWKAEIERDHATLGSVIADMIANPTGGAETGIVCHVEEMTDPEKAGAPLTLIAWRGQGKTVASWLSEWGQQTGYRWYCECLSGTWHFHWFNPSNCPTWAVTLKDGIDYGAESATQWRVLDGANLTKSRAEYANRVRYKALYEPPTLPAGAATWDDVWTEADDMWGAYTNCTVSEDATKFSAGTKSILFTYEITGGAGGTVLPRSGLSLGYFLMPAEFRDFQNNFYDGFRIATGMHWTLDGDDWVVGWVGAANGTYGQTLGYMTAYSGASVGPSGGVPLNQNAWPWIHLSSGIDRDTFEMHEPATLLDRGIGIDVKDSATTGGATFDANNVNAVALHIAFPNNDGYPDIVIPEGSVFQCKVWLDNIRLVTVLRNERPDLGDFYVETDAVTAGTEVPIEVELPATTSMTQEEARKLALAWLAIRGRTKSTLSGLSVAGVRNVPMRVMVPVALAGGPVISASYPLSEITWRPADAGWSTELTLGDMPTDLLRTLERTRHGIQSLRAEARTA
jgi:hypothetical protein